MLKRIGYYLTMYSGFRAMANWLRHLSLGSTPVSTLNNGKFRLHDGRGLGLKVHSRLVRDRGGRMLSGGMFSTWLLSPPIQTYVYRLLRLTSHFGCGHIEVAFIEFEDQIVIYAVRNILKSNLDRIGFRRISARLGLCEEQSEIAVIRSIAQLTREQGLQIAVATPQDCVQLAVTPLLIHPTRIEKTLNALEKKYLRIVRQCGLEVVRISNEEQIASPSHAQRNNTQRNIAH
ncbi:MAG: hypothetical protein AAF456_22995 [Planctomycetota bacterium]